MPVQTVAASDDPGIAITREKFRDDLNAAFDKALPTHPDVFDNVNVLSVHFKSAPQALIDSGHELMATFSKVYHYKTETYEVDHRSQTLVVDICRKLMEFVEKGDFPRTLNIIFYSGHSIVQGSTNDLVLGGNFDSHNNMIAPTFNWTRAAPTILGCNNGGRVLLIFDSCFPVLSNREKMDPEVLAVSGKENRASPVSNFTNALSQKLKQYNGAAATVSMIYAELIQEMHSSGLVYNPVHICQAEESSITLERVMSQIPQTRTQNLAEKCKTFNEKVILTVRLRDQDPCDLDQWGTWLTHLSNGLQNIKLEILSAHRSSSAVIVVAFTIPTIIWSCLDPQSKAYNFDAHISGTNFVNI